MAEGILALMNSFCLAQVVDLSAVLGLGIDDEVDMFLELAQLAQLESLGFLNVLGAQNLIESNLLFNGNEDVLNIGESFLRFPVSTGINISLTRNLSWPQA